MTEGNNQFVSTPELSGNRQESSTWFDRAGVADTDIGRVLKEQFAALESAERMEAWPVAEAEVVDRRDIDVFREVLSSIMDELGQSEAVVNARRKAKSDGYETLTQIERSALLQAFDRARAKALERVDMSGRQSGRLRFATTSELNYSLRSFIREGTPDAWMILNPKLRRVDVMDSPQIIRYLRNSLTPSVDVEFLASAPAIKPEVLAAVDEVRDLPAAA